MIEIELGVTDQTKPMVMFGNVFAGGTLTATSQADGFDVGYIADYETGYGWKPAVDTIARATVVLGAGVEANCFFVTSHNLGSNAATLTLEYYNGVTWVGVYSVTPTTNDDIMYLFNDITASQWRVSQVGGASFIGVVRLGSRLVFPNGIDQSYSSIPHAKVVEVQGMQTVSGAYVGQMITRYGFKTSATFPLLDSSWVDTDMKPFETHYNDALPFVYAANPQRFPDDYGYCWRPSNSGTLMPKYKEGGMYEEFTIELQGFVNARTV